MIIDIIFSCADPVVLATWRCKNLKEIVIIGQKYYSHNLLAIVRLQQKLERLEFAESDIVYDESWIERKEIINVSRVAIIQKVPLSKLPYQTSSVSRK